MIYPLITYVVGLLVWLGLGVWRLSKRPQSNARDAEVLFFYGTLWPIVVVGLLMVALLGLLLELPSRALLWMARKLAKRRTT